MYIIIHAADSLVVRVFAFGAEGRDCLIRSRVIPKTLELVIDALFQAGLPRVDVIVIKVFRNFEYTVRTPLEDPH